MSARIRVHATLTPTELQRSMGGAISGKLCLQVQDVYLPAANWIDLVVPVLTWWIDSALGLATPDARVVNRFMDGTYQILITRSAGQPTIAITLTNHGRAVAGPFSVPLERYLAALRGAAKSILHEIHREALPHSLDIASLVGALDHLERFEEQIREHGERALKPGET